MGDRCLGHCCRAFPLSVPYDDLLASARAIVAGKDRYITAQGLERGHLRDAEIVAEMLIPLGKHKVSLSTGHDFGVPREMFTCKHLMSNGNCAIYYRRPALCRDYPYRGEVCDQPACEWDEARNPRPVAAELVQLKRAQPDPNCVPFDDPGA